MRPLLPCLLLPLLACGHPEVCREGQSPKPVRLPADPVTGLHRFAHAHNDYEHTRPLEDALAARFSSVEADVFYASGKFEVSHGGLSGSKGTLKDLYLDPLQAKVTATGSVHGDGKPFTLWIDLKDAPKELPAALEALLAQYPMLSYADASGAHPGPVSVILTGERAGKEGLAALETRHATRDSNDYTPNDPANDGRWTAYALDWGKYVGWNGQGELPADAAERLGCIVENAHQTGRQVRFYGTPDGLPVWQTSLDNGVDFINTDKLAELDAFLESAPR